MAHELQTFFKVLNPFLVPKSNLSDTSKPAQAGTGLKAPNQMKEVWRAYHSGDENKLPKGLGQGKVEAVWWYNLNLSCTSESPEELKTKTKTKKTPDVHTITQPD